MDRISASAMLVAGVSQLFHRHYEEFAGTVQQWAYRESCHLHEIQPVTMPFLAVPGGLNKVSRGFPSGTLAPAIRGRNLAPRLRRVVFISKPALRLRLDVQRGGLCAVGGGCAF